MRVMSAGDGYQYLLRTVAAGDGDRSLSTRIATVIGRTYQSVLEATLRDAGYLDGPWTTTDDH